MQHKSSKNLIVVPKFQRKFDQKCNPYGVETFMNIFKKPTKMFWEEDYTKFRGPGC